MKGTSTSLWSSVYPCYRVFRAWQARAARLEFHFQFLNVRKKLTPVAEMRYKQWQIVYSDFLTASRLDDYPVKYRNYGAALRAYGSVEDHCRDVFGEYIPKVISSSQDSVAKALYKVMRSTTISGRVSELMFRLTAEFEYALTRNWFVVFNTLTVADWAHDQVFAVGSRAWTDYRRRVERASPGTTTFAVVESGAENGRLHIHCLHFMPRLPRGCSDPNLGRVHALEKEIEGFRRFWPFGWSSPRPVRMATRDQFSAVGWRWPAERVGNQILPVALKPYQAVVAYIIKYVSKSYNEPKEYYQWRTRMTRQFGLKQMDEMVSSLRLAHLKIILQKQMTPVKALSGVRLPVNLLRKLAARNFLKRKGLNKLALPVKSLRTKSALRVYRSILELPLSPNLLERWKIMTRPILKSRLQKLRLFPSLPTSSEMVASDEFSSFVLKWLDSVFPSASSVSVRGCV